MGNSHYKAMVELHSKLHSDGLEILGFPCNQFGVISGQEGKPPAEIRAFVDKKFGVGDKLHMMEKIEVNGEGTHPVYQVLKGDGGAKIGWNFGASYLVTPSESGNEVTIARYDQSPDKLMDIIVDALKVP